MVGISTTPSAPQKKKQVILEFKICPKKQVILPYLESARACKNKLESNMANNSGKHGHFTFLLICPKTSRMTCFLGWREY